MFRSSDLGVELGLVLRLWGVYTNQQTSSSIITYGSKRPAIHVYFEYICWKFAGRLLDRVNTLLRLGIGLGLSLGL